MKLQRSSAVMHAIKLVCLLLMLVLMLIPSISIYTVDTEGENLSVLSVFVKTTNEKSAEAAGNENAYVLNVPQLAIEMWDYANDCKDFGATMDTVSPSHEAIDPYGLSEEQAQFHEDMKFNRMFMVTAQVITRVLSVLMFAAMALLILEILASAAHLVFTLHPDLVWVKKKSPIANFFFSGGLFSSYLACFLFQFCILGAWNLTLATMKAGYRMQMVFQGVHFAIVWAIVFCAYAVAVLIMKKVFAQKMRREAEAAVWLANEDEAFSAEAIANAEEQKADTAEAKVEA
ncbi:MAG: hypothetical protein IJW49_09420 [Clostridia bacterium]|nr:hypothetical protein [Clostridia bacterium]